VYDLLYIPDSGPGLGSAAKFVFACLCSVPASPCQTGACLRRDQRLARYASSSLASIRPAAFRDRRPDPIAKNLEPCLFVLVKFRRKNVGCYRLDPGHRPRARIYLPHAHHTKTSINPPETHGAGGVLANTHTNTNNSEVNSPVEERTFGGSLLKKTDTWVSLK